MDKIRVMLVEDHSMVRQGLKQLIELESDIKVVAEAPMVPRLPIITRLRNPMWY